MNFIDYFLKGQEGKNIGLPTGLKGLTKAIDGIQRSAIYGIAAAPKVGKTTFADQCFMIEPFLFYMNYKQENPDSKLEIQWIYYSFEINRIRKQFKYAAFFMYRDYGIATFRHKDKIYPMSPRYLEGKLLDHENEPIKIYPDHLEKLKEIYKKRIVPIFGDYDSNGRCIQKGVVEFIEQRDNPTGLRNYLLRYAEENGRITTESYQTKEEGKVVTKQRRVGNVPVNPEKYTIVITDHVRKLNRERGFTMKDNIDKWIEYSVELRNMCGFTFVHIVHLNRSLSDTERIKFFSKSLYPTGDDVKDTGNLSEEADYLITLFNPKDEKYNIKEHFGLIMENYPNYRSIHLVESRDTECPVHMQSQMYGNINHFIEI